MLAVWGVQEKRLCATVLGWRLLPWNVPLQRRFLLTDAVSLKHVNLRQIIGTGFIHEARLVRE